MEGREISEIVLTRDKHDDDLSSEDTNTPYRQKEVTRILKSLT